MPRNAAAGPGAGAGDAVIGAGIGTSSDILVWHAVLHGVDTRSTCRVACPEAELGAAEIMSRRGSALSTQADGPKIT